ncbi:putative receptor-like protein kinase At4g00960 [Tripterygium wilfordii]|uniref:putative receptor-like protein kinase At4g00960 n=1 Tax=Tripterygium wilfordii TaxID=458696 RepID=UPI0018F7F0D9|nr:putative receptor-like protein kinase At4g00960 [Tripterygium wilfordii]
MVICSGYMAPEYFTKGRYSTKSDVYSFGVMVLEVVSGQKIGYFRVGEDVVDLKTYAWQSWNQGAAMDLIDPTLGGPTSKMMRCIHIGLLCVQENAANRPTMATVVLMLNSCSYIPPAPSRPGFFVHGSNESNRRDRECSHQSVNEASITEPYPR